MKVAIIDIGTNTFHLIIADQSNLANFLHKEKVAVQLGKGGISKGLLLEEAMERAIVTLADFKLKIDAAGVSETRVIATSAVRSASNQKEFVDLVYSETGLKINVLSGKAEASLIHQGVRECTDFENGIGLIMDIGGGSIEFIRTDKNEVKWLRSYELGGQRLIDRFHQHDPIPERKKKGLEEFLEKELQEVFEVSKRYEASYLIGSSGFFDTFWDIWTKKRTPLPMLKPILDRESFDVIHMNLISKNREERLLIKRMIPMRIDMIVSASIATSIVMNNCGFEQIKISPFALREGLLFNGLPKRK